MATNWTSPSTFAFFYNLDVVASSVTHAVLAVANTSQEVLGWVTWRLLATQTLTLLSHSSQTRL